MSLALPREGKIGQSRAIPVDFSPLPTVVRPRKTTKKEQWQAYKEEKKIAKLSRQGSDRIALLRKTLDDQGHKNKELVVGVDGSYTNKEVLKNLPQRVTLIVIRPLGYRLSKGSRMLYWEPAYLICTETLWTSKIFCRLTSGVGKLKSTFVKKRLCLDVVRLR